MTRRRTALLSVGIAFTVVLAALAVPALSVGTASAGSVANGTTQTSTPTATTTTVATTATTATATPTTATTTSTATTTATATETATATSTTEAGSASAQTTEQECDPTASEPKLAQSRLYAPDTTIETGSPGRIAGGFRVDPTARCPVVVHVTMQVPSGMSIEGSSDIASGGAGMVTARFTVRPGANVKDISARVYSRDAGERTVTADIQYWPVGHEEMAREIDGLSFTYDVEEPLTPTETTGAESGERTTEADGGFEFSVDVPGFGVPATVVALLGCVLLLRRR